MLSETSSNSLKFMQDFELFMDNFWQNAFNIPLHLDGCTGNSDDAWEVVMSALRIIQNPSDPIQIAKSVNFIIEHYDAFVLAFSGCVDSSVQITQGFIRLADFGGPVGFSLAITNAIKSHPIGFMLNVKRAQSAITEG